LGAGCKITFPKLSVMGVKKTGTRSINMIVVLEVKLPTGNTKKSEYGLEMSKRPVRGW
jgi:hypothetical protein